MPQQIICHLPVLIIQAVLQLIVWEENEYAVFWDSVYIVHIEDCRTYPPPSEVHYQGRMKVIFHGTVSELIFPQ